MHLTVYAGLIRVYLLISLINSTHLSAYNRVYSLISLITFDVLEAVIAVCRPPPQWCASSHNQYHATERNQKPFYGGGSSR